MINWYDLCENKNQLCITVSWSKDQVKEKWDRNTTILLDYVQSCLHNDF